METFAAVLMLMISGNYTVDVTPIYFASMEACEATLPAIVEQARETRGLPIHITAKCYEEAAGN